MLLFVLLSMLNESSGILTKAIGATRRYDGPMGKSDRALMIGLTCLVFYFFPEADIAANYIFSGMCILLIVSTYLRLRNGLREINS